MSIIEMLRAISGVTLPEPYNLIEYLIAYGFSFVLLLFALKVLFSFIPFRSR